MVYEREEAGRLQDATEAMIRMRQPVAKRPVAGPMPEPLPDLGGENGEAFQNMAAHIWAAGASLEDADFITRMLARKGLYLFETKPWDSCPSTHCRRRGECASPRDCTIKSPIATI